MPNTSDESQKALSKVHELLAQSMMEELAAGGVDTARLKVIVEFLKNNEVTVDPVRLRPAANLIRKLPHTGDTEAC